VSDIASQIHIVTTAPTSRRRIVWGNILHLGSFALLVGTIVLLWTRDAPSWRPALYAFLLWATALCVSQVVLRGEMGKRSLFILPAVLFVGALVVFPMLFGLTIAFSDWNLSSSAGRSFNGLNNVRQMLADPFYWNAALNMVWYSLAIAAEYVIAFGLALMLSMDIRARKFFRVAFLLPLMLSPVAVSWMIGKSMLEVRFGPVANFARWLGIADPSFFQNPAVARAMIMVMDAWTFIPFMMIMLLAGLQSIPNDVQEAAKVDGATGMRRFWEITFPLMIPMSISAILIRLIFKLKLADIVINVTSGGPGGATDTITSFIFREYRDRSNVGYGTLLAMVYLVLITITISGFIKVFDRWLNPRY
jgi:multiple sugar transport system permease protein